MDERVRFSGRLLDGEAMSEVCREIGLPRYRAQFRALGVQSKRRFAFSMFGREIHFGLYDTFIATQMP